MTALSTTAPAPSIAVADLTLRYGADTALDGLSFTLDRPGIHGLLGRNGSGKTSLLSVLAGLRPHQAGTVRLFGQPVFENGAVMRNLCLIREDGDVIESSEKITAALDFESDMRPYWDDEKARALLDSFGLSPNKKLGTLSRGQRSALACTIGIASRAPITFFDESYLGMDAPSRYAFYEALRADYTEHPRLILLSTHLIDEVARLFDHVLIIDGGRVMLSDEAENLRGRGLRLTGPADSVGAVTEGLPILETRDLGSTRSVAVDRVPADLAARAQAAGLTVDPLPIQDLFIHLTAPRKAS